MRNLHLLERFRITAEEGTVHGAARRLGITQPALTKSIRTLEQDHEVELFERHARGVALTPDGERLLGHVKVISRELQFAEAELAAFRTGQKGILRIGAGVAWAAVLLPPLLERVHRAYPDVHIDLATGSSPELLTGLVNGDIDIMTAGFSSETEDLPPYLEKRTVLTMHMRMVAREGHPLRSLDEVPFSALTRFPWIVYKSDPETLTTGNRRVLDLLGDPPKVLMSSESLLALVQMVENGNHLACLAEPFVESLKGFSVRPLKIAGDLGTFRSGVIFRKSLIGVAPFSMLLRCLDEIAEQSERVD